MIVITFNHLKKKYWIENTLERKEREKERINFSYADRPHEGRLLLFIFFLVKVPGFQSHTIMVMCT